MERKANNNQPLDELVQLMSCTQQTHDKSGYTLKAKDRHELHADTQTVCNAMTTIRHYASTNAQPRLSSKSALVEGSAHSEAQARVSSAVEMALGLATIPRERPKQSLRRC